MRQQSVGDARRNHAGQFRDTGVANEPLISKPEHRMKYQGKAPSVYIVRYTDGEAAEGVVWSSRRCLSHDGLMIRRSRIVCYIPTLTFGFPGGSSSARNTP